MSESVDLILSLVCPWLVTSNDQYLYLFQMYTVYLLRHATFI